MIKSFFGFLFALVVFVMAIYQARNLGPVERILNDYVKPAVTRARTLVKVRLPARSPADPATLYLKNGSTISGGLIYEGENGVRISWEGGEVFFSKAEIERVEKGKFQIEKEGLLFPEETETEWPYEQEAVVHLTDQRILDEAIGDVRGDTVILRREFEEGGAIEQEIHRSQIEYLAFKPIRNERSRKIEESLRTQFPKMKWYREGTFNLLTDSYATWVNEYKKGIQELRTDFYLTFFPILKERTPHVAHYVVIFDEWDDFIEHGDADGVPALGLAGYFSPDTEVLYLFNMLGDSFSAFLESALVGGVGKAMDQAADSVKSQVDKRYHVFVEGKADEVKNKFAGYHSYLRGIYREQTMETLRHEMVHELFHNWGLQTVIVSKIRDRHETEADKKKKFLEEADSSKKRELLLELAQLRKQDTDVQVEASNSWFVEGLAAYMEPTPVGGVSKRWLYTFQEARRKGRLFPIEHLTVYKMGSFPGVASESQLFAYAQSWAFVHFLMSRYPENFMRYLDRISRETPEENEDILWLLESLGKELRPLEEEFLAYMEQFEELEDPMLEELDTMISMFQAF